MDTDWCIVCDTKIVLPDRAHCDTHENDGEPGDQPEAARVPACLSAFCSQDCLIKSYLEAASQAYSHHHPAQPNGSRSRTQTPDSFMLHPGHPKKKLSTGADRALDRVSSTNRKYLSVYRGRKKVVSRFTLDSCGSSSPTSSSSP